MIFQTPEWLFGLALPFIYFLAHRRFHWKSQIILWMVVILFILALARPSLSDRPAIVDEAGSDVVLAIDMSYSMRATDIPPSRLEAGKVMIKDLLSSNTTERFGVVAHTTSAIILSPLTRDRELLLHLVDTIDVNQIITKGTNLMSALELSRKMSHAKHPLLVLLTDGGDQVSYENEALYAKENGFKVCVVLLASSQGSMLPSDNGNLKDDQGHLVISSRNDAVNIIADQTGGIVINGLKPKELGDWISKERQADYANKTTIIQYTELFYFPLILGLIFLMGLWTNLGTLFKKKGLFVLALIGINVHAGVIDYPATRLGMYFYANQQYEASAYCFQKNGSFQGQYNYANALYKMGKYHAALQVYQKLKNENPHLKSYVFYNMGNSFVRLNQFDAARNAFLKSLTLKYSKQADQNLRAIQKIKDQKTLNVRKKKQDKMQRDETNSTGESSLKKEGGGSNMQSDIASSGAGDAMKKTQGDPRFSTSQGKASLSSKQYELINQRSVYEAKPW